MIKSDTSQPLQFSATQERQINENHLSLPPSSKVPWSWQPLPWMPSHNWHGSLHHRPFAYTLHVWINSIYFWAWSYFSELPSVENIQVTNTIPKPISLEQPSHLPGSYLEPSNKPEVGPFTIVPPPVDSLQKLPRCSSVYRGLPSALPYQPLPLHKPLTEQQKQRLLGVWTKHLEPIVTRKTNVIGISSVTAITRASFPHACLTGAEGNLATLVKLTLVTHSPTVTLLNRLHRQ